MLRPRRSAAGLLILLAVGAACSDGDESTAPSTTAGSGSTVSTAPPVSVPESEPCGPFPPLTATRLPTGWSERLLPGDGGHPDERPCSAYHWAPATADGDPPDGRYINVLAGRSPSPIDRTGAETVVVAGRSASLGAIHEGFAVEFNLYGASRDHPYALVAYGISRDELRQAAEGLLPQWVAGDDQYPERPVDKLGDGRHPVKISDLSSEWVVIGPVGWLTGKAADDWSVAHGEPGGAPNDYVLVDDDPRTGRFPLDPKVVVTSVWARYGQPPGYGEIGVCELCPRLVGLTGESGLVELFHHAKPDEPAAHLRTSPYWVTITGGVVTRIDEQYVP